jgi:hypothetical protein
VDGGGRRPAYESPAVGPVLQCPRGQVGENLRVFDFGEADDVRSLLTVGIERLQGIGRPFEPLGVERGVPGRGAGPEFRILRPVVDIVEEVVDVVGSDDDRRVGLFAPGQGTERTSDVVVIPFFPDTLHDRHAPGKKRRFKSVGKVPLWSSRFYR